MQRLAIGVPKLVQTWSQDWTQWLAPKTLSALDIDGFSKAQETARNAVKAVSQDLRPGWTEKKAASLVDTYLRDCGITSFFHHSFAWFGERTRFDGIRGYAAFSPSSRVLGEGEVYILDTAPIVGGYICDIGYTGCAGENPEYRRALEFLWTLRSDIPKLAFRAASGGELWRQVESRFLEAGYECTHKKYPFEVLGHRVHRVNRAWGKSQVLNFGIASYAELSSRFLWDQLLTSKHDRPLRGAWAIEPHLGTTHLGSKNFGAKFEEILYIDEQSAGWIHPEELACLPPRQSLSPVHRAL